MTWRHNGAAPAALAERSRPTDALAPPIRVLAPSIADPLSDRSGAATVTRGLIRMLETPPLSAEVACIPAFDKPVRSRRLRQALCLTRSVVSGKPAKPLFVSSRRLVDEYRRRIAAEDFDLLLLNGSDLVELLTEVPANVRTVLVVHNIEHQLYSEQIRRAPNWLQWARTGLWKDQQRLRDFELQGFRRCGSAVFLSRCDEEYALKQAPNLRSMVMPPVFDYDPFVRPRRDVGPILHLGVLAGFSWWPNGDATRWFLERVLPHVPGIRLHLFGEGSRALGAGVPRTVAHGPVEALQTVWETCDLMVCPVRTGGGVCVKLAEGIYNGMPTVATPFSARGLATPQDEALQYLDGADEWISFLRSPQARALARTRPAPSLVHSFSAAANARRLHRFLQHVLTET